MRHLFAAALVTLMPLAACSGADSASAAMASSADGRRAEAIRFMADLRAARRARAGAVRPAWIPPNPRPQAGRAGSLTPWNAGGVPFGGGGGHSGSIGVAARIRVQSAPFAHG